MPYLDVQATAVSYRGCVVLIQGPSGIGKTHLALRLIELGAKLVGDDCVQLFLKKDKLYCRAKKKFKGVLEIRELGLINGFKVSRANPVSCLVRLHNKRQERFPKSKQICLLGKKIPVFDFYACEMNDIQVLYALKVLNGTYSFVKE